MPRLALSTSHTYLSLAPVFTLLLSFCILSLGHGLQTILVPARATLEGYSETALGILSSAYFVGFITGTFTAPRLIARVGHVHVFAASASGAAAAMLCMPLLSDTVSWVLLRFLYGLCLVQFYTVMESWLNSISQSHTRGKILSCYMILSFIAMSSGQLMFSSTRAGGFQMFSICGLMLCLALIPLLLSRIRRPDEVLSPEPFGLKQLYTASPLGAAGALCVGLMAGAYWGLTAPFILSLGFEQAHIAWFMSISLLGGLFAQWPLGALSDYINRRWVILLAAGIICASCMVMSSFAMLPSPSAHIGIYGLLLFGVLFGAGFHPLYSLCIAHTNDFVPHGKFVEASASLQLVQSTGAITGSILSGILAQQLGASMLYGYIGTLAGFLCAYTVIRLMQGRIPKYIAPFRFLTRTGSNAIYLDPRS